MINPTAWAVYDGSGDLADVITDGNMVEALEGDDRFTLKPLYEAWHVLANEGL